MNATPRSDFLAIVRVLGDHDVKFIIVGGVAAVVQGAPVTTFDLDVLHERSEANVERLVGAVEVLDACYRFRPRERQRPAGHQLLLTRYGPLDLLGSIGDSLSYDDLLPESTEVELETDLKVALLKLAAIIRVKEELARPQDLAVLPVLRRTMEEREH